MRKRILALVMSLVLLMTILPMPTRAATERYIPVIEQAIDDTLAYVKDEELLGIFDHGYLCDLDKDGVQELVMSYVYDFSSEHPDMYPCWYVYSIYDIENGVVKTITEKEPISGDAGGSYGYAGIVTYKGFPMVMTYAESGETSWGPDAKYPNWECEVTLYDSVNYKPVHTIGIRTTNTELFYSIDGVEVTAAAFAQEMSDYTYLELVEENELAYTNDSMTLTELLDSIGAETDEDIEYENLTREEWVKQHKEYATSALYQSQIVQGFTGQLSNTLEKIKADGEITAYKTLDSVNKVLGFDVGGISDSQEYELLLAQVLFNSIGTASLEEIYYENLTEVVLELGKNCLAAGKKIGFLSDYSQGLWEILEKLSDFSAEDDNYIDALNNLFDFMGTYDSENLRKEIINQCTKDTTWNILTDVVSDQIKEAYGTFKEMAMYLAVGEAYSRTSNAFGELLLEMRRHIDVPSDNALFVPYTNYTGQSDTVVTDENIWMLLDIDKPNDLLIANPLNTPVVLSDLAKAIEDFYTTIQMYSKDGAEQIVNNAIDEMLEIADEDICNIAANTVISFYDYLPVLREFSALRKVLTTAQTITDLFTGIDDRADQGTMVMRLYCIEYIHYLTVNNLASSPWDTLPINATTSLEEYLFEKAVFFDESISIYKSIQSLAIDYACAYYRTYLNSNAVATSDKARVSTIITELKQQKTQIDNIKCHKFTVNPFADVSSVEYYYEPVLWATEKGITTGMTETSFVPADTCTRAQIATFLWRANGSPAPTSSNNPFTDVPAGQWYTDAVLWAVENGITTGTSATTFSPDDGCTRGQVATFLWRSRGKPVVVNSANPFADLVSGAYYYDAVLWAVENSITNGLSSTTFGPNTTCTRGQIVTFLYRYDSIQEQITTDKVKSLKINRTYSLGDVIDAGDLDLTAVYESSKKEAITSGYTCSITGFDEAGTQNITVSYGGITETFGVEVLDFYALELGTENNSGTGYNEDGRVSWVLYITARYNGNYVKYAFDSSIVTNGSWTGDWVSAWEGAKKGESAKWEYGYFSDFGFTQYHAGGAFILPDDPSFAGQYTANVTFGDVTKTAVFTLVYNGNYETGTGWSVADVNWK